MTTSREELLNDAEAAQRTVLSSLQSSMWTAMPAIVQSVDLEAMTLVAQIAIQGSITNESGETQNVNISPIQDVPIVFPSGGGFIMTYPIAEGDEVLLVFASRCIDAWWQSGGYANLPLELRMHDLSDGFAIPGPRSQANLISGISSTDLQIRNAAGDTFLAITGAGLIGCQNATTSLKTVLTNLQATLNTFMGVLAGYSGGATPATQAQLQVPAAAAATSLATILTEIGTLLE